MGTDEVHDLVTGDIVIHGKLGTGTVKNVKPPTPNSSSKGRALINFHDEQVGTKDAEITSLCWNGQRCQVVKAYVSLLSKWPVTKEDTINQGFKWGTCSKCHKSGSCDDPNNEKRKHRHYKCDGVFNNILRI